MATALAYKDEISREDMITEYLPYVKRIVHRIAVHLPSTVDAEDLMNVGVIGLIQAVDRYDPKRDNKFMTYAIFRIRGAVLSELRSRDFLSRTNRRKLRELETVINKLEQQLSRGVNSVEIAEKMGVDIEQIHRTKAMSGISFISFEELGISSKDEKAKLFRYVCEGNGDTESQFYFEEQNKALTQAIEYLSENERLIISLYYYSEHTMKEIGKALGITESRACQIHGLALFWLKFIFNHPLNGQKGIDKEKFNFIRSLFLEDYFLKEKIYRTDNPYKFVNSIFCEAISSLSENKRLFANLYFTKGYTLDEVSVYLDLDYKKAEHMLIIVKSNIKQFVIYILTGEYSFDSYKEKSLKFIFSGLETFYKVRNGNGYDRRLVEEILRKAIPELPPRAAKAAKLTWLENVSISNRAKILEIKNSGVVSFCYRANKYLRKVLLEISKL